MREVSARDIAVGAVLQDVHVGRDINLTVNQAARVAAAVDEKVRFASLLAERTALFAGREAEMDQLSRFADGVGGYLFVSAPSGYGKTALLANWVSQLEAREQPVAYAFINRLAGHASEDGTLRALCQQLAEFHGETTAVPASIGELHARYLELLTTPPVGTSIAVVIDGLDEADGWTATRDLFPPILPEGVAVVLSAREVADRDWIEVVGLKSAKPQRLRLGTLDAAQIGEVVAAAGVPPWAHDQEALKQIHSLSEGDPLYVRYLVDDLTPDEDGQARFASLADLGRQPAGPSGLTGYFDTWWEQLAEAEGESTGLGDAVFDFLCYLLVAKGPLTRDDLSHVTLDDNLDDRTIDKVSAAVRRFIVGDRRVGYSLGHPRFQSYLSEERLTEPTRRPYRDRLIAFCARWDEHGSLYALRHYAEHLAEAEDDGEFFTLVRDEEFAAAQSSYLPSEPRLPAKACELAYATAADKDDAPGMAEFALQKARRLAAARTALSPLAAAREINVETAWALADLHEPQDRDLWYLLVAWELKEAGQPGVAQVTLGRLAKTELAPLRWDTVGVFANLAELGVELTSGLQTQLLSEGAIVKLSATYVAMGNIAAAHEAAQAIADESDRVQALATIAEGQAQAGDNSGARATYAAALETAQAITEEWDRSWALAAIAEAEAQLGDFSRAVETAQAVANVGFRGRALAAIAQAQAQAGDTSGALKAAQAIVNDDFRGRALAAIAQAQAQAGDTSGALATYAAALETAQSIVDPSDRTNALAAIAGAQVQAGDTSGARTTYAAAHEAAQPIGDESDRAQALATIAEGQAQAGDNSGARATYAAALETAQAITDGSKRAAALTAVAQAQALVGDARAALQTARAIEGDWDRTWALTGVAEAQAQAGDASGALQTVQTITDGWTRGRALAAVAEAQIETGDANDARATYAAALEAVQTIANGSNLADALAAIAEAQREAGDASGARATYAAALAATQAIADESDRARALSAIGHAQAQAGDVRAAIKTAQAITNEFDRAHAHAAIAEARIEAGDASGAHASFTQGLEAAQAIADLSERAQALAFFARAQAQAGDASGARASHTAALEASQAIADEWDRAWALARIAQAQVHAGDANGALETVQAIASEPAQANAFAAIAGAQAQAGDINGALGTAQMIASEQGRARVLPTLAQAQAQAGDTSGARTTYAAAHEAAQAIADESDRAQALATIAEGQAQAGDNSGARATYAAALETAEAIENETSRAEALTAIAQAQAQAGDTSGARTTYAAALEAAEAANDDHARRRTVGLLASSQARTGFAKEALDLLAITPITPGDLSEIANALADLGDAHSLKQVIIEGCAEYIQLSPTIIKCLTRAYPTQTTALAERAFRVLA